MSQIKSYSFSYRSLITFSIPSILSSLFEPLASVVDTAFVGHLSTQWVAALAICSIIFGSLTWIFNFIVHTSTQAVAGAYASGNIQKLQTQMKVSLLVSIGIGLFAFIIMSLFKEFFFHLAGTSEQIYPFVNEYYSIRLIFHPTLIFFVTLIALLRGLGQVRASFVIITITTLLNILLTWIFLYVLKMSIGGAAWGTSLANILGCFIALIVLFRPKIRRRGFWQALPEKTQWFHFGRSSIHLFGRSLTLSSVFFLSTRFASTFGTTGLAAYQVAMQIWLLASFLTDGLAITANVYVSHFTELKQKKEIMMTVRRLIILSIGIGLSLSLIYWFGSDFIWSIFSKDSELLALLSLSWWLIASSQLPNAITYTLDGVMFGLAKFSFLRTHIMIGSFLFYLPMAFYSQYSLEVQFLWGGIILLNLYRGISSYFNLYIEEYV
jgi:putative MATE family efflux protein